MRTAWLLPDLKTRVRGIGSVSTRHYARTVESATSCVNPCIYITYARRARRSILPAATTAERTDLGDDANSCHDRARAPTRSIAARGLPNSRGGHAFTGRFRGG